MQLFLSYPSAERPLAERLLLALEAEGHQVFMDRHDLPAGQSFHQPLREAIEAADAMVVLVTPAAVAPGSYVLAELEIARQHWRRPSGRVLPVLVQPTPIASLPPWLSAVTVLQPRGEPVAETVAAVARLRAGATGGRGWRIAVSAAVALVLGVGGWQLAERRAAEARQAEVAALQAQAAQLLPLCVDGQHAATLQQLGALAASAAQSAAASALQAAQQDCALRWLREMRATRGGPTPRSFAEQVAVVQPVLLQALASAQGQRAADLRAHLGWAAFLLAREGAAGGDPSALWQQALQDEPGNVYAHAMWGRALLPARLAEAQHALRAGTGRQAASAASCARCSSAAHSAPAPTPRPMRCRWPTRCSAAARCWRPSCDCACGTTPSACGCCSPTTAPCCWQRCRGRRCWRCSMRCTPRPRAPTKRSCGSSTARCCRPRPATATAHATPCRRWPRTWSKPARTGACWPRPSRR